MQLLKIQAYLSHIQLAAIFFTSEMDYDAFLPTFTAIVELSEAVHPYVSTILDTNSGERKAAGRLFRFHIGIVYPLVCNQFLLPPIPASSMFLEQDMYHKIHKRHQLPSPALCPNLLTPIIHSPSPELAAVIPISGAVL